MTALATALAVAAAGAGGGQADGAAGDLGAAQLAGQRVVTGFSGYRPPPDLLRRIRRGKVGGVILFGHNVRGTRQVARLVGQLQRARRPAAVDEPLLVMADQEGGPVRRIPGPPRRSAAAIGATGRAAAARGAGRAAGRLLRSARVNVDLAPVADVARLGSAMARERRAYGRRARKVARFAAAFASGLRREGVLATGKHFPGFGAARANTDFSRVTIHTPRKRLRAVDERPYRLLFRRGVRLVMLSTAIYPALDPEAPAAFSRRIASGELRGRLGFRGVSVTDALGTPATAPFGDPAEVVVTAARAGVDLMLYSSYPTAKAAARNLARAIRRGRLRRAAAQRSVRRILAVRRRLP